MSAIASASRASARRMRRVDLIIRAPVLSHQFARPPRLTNGAAREELRHHGFDVHYGRAVRGVEPFDFERPAPPGDETNDGGAKQVGPPAASLGENADARPRGIAARMSRAARDLALVGAVEDEEDLRVRELLEPVERLGIERVRELDAALDAVPVVVAKVCARAAHEPDGR